MDGGGEVQGEAKDWVGLIVRFGCEMGSEEWLKVPV